MTNERWTKCPECGTDIRYTCGANLWCQNCGTLDVQQECKCNHCHPTAVKPTTLKAGNSGAARPDQPKA